MFMYVLIKKSPFFFIAISLVLFIFIFKDVPLKSYILIFDYHKVTPLSPFYYVKIFREFMQSKFTFGTEEQAYRYLNLADKRITEAGYLKTAGANMLSKKQVYLAQQYQKIASNYLRDLKDKQDINYLLQMEKDNELRLQTF